MAGAQRLRDALQGFAKMLGAPGDDGVFRYQPSPVEEDLPKPEDDSAEVAEWFNTQTDPEIAQAVAQAVAEARTPVSGHASRRTGPIGSAYAVAAAVYPRSRPPPARRDGARALKVGHRGSPARGRGPSR